MSNLARNGYHSRADYGYDAPHALVIFTLVGGTAAIGSLVALLKGSGRLAAMMALYALFFLGNALSFFYTTRRGKFRFWEEILDGLQLRGDEHVLDMGCGRGAVLTAVARRLTTGRATGVDLWRSIDQSGNAPDATMANATIEGVATRIVLETGDMRQLPFANASFD